MLDKNTPQWQPIKGFFSKNFWRFVLYEKRHEWLWPLLIFVFVVGGAFCILPLFFQNIWQEALSQLDWIGIVVTFANLFIVIMLWFAQAHAQWKASLDHFLTVILEEAQESAENGASRPANIKVLIVMVPTQPSVDQRQLAQAVLSSVNKNQRLPLKQWVYGLQHQGIWHDRQGLFNQGRPFLLQMVRLRLHISSQNRAGAVWDPIDRPDQDQCCLYVAESQAWPYPFACRQISLEQAREWLHGPQKIARITQEVQHEQA